MHRAMFSFCLWLSAAVSAAPLPVEIVGGAMKKIPILLSFSSGHRTFSENLLANLDYWSVFNVRLVSEPLTCPLSVQDWSAWRRLLINTLWIGTLKDNKNSINISFVLCDLSVNKVARKASWIQENPRALERLADKVSDVLYQDVAGYTSYFDSELVFVRSTKRSHDIVGMSPRGSREHIIYHDSFPLMSPSLSPTGDWLSFVKVDQNHQTHLCLFNMSSRAVQCPLAHMLTPRWLNDHTLLMTQKTVKEYRLVTWDINTHRSKSLWHSACILFEPAYQAPDLYITEMCRPGQAHVYHIDLSQNTKKRLLTTDNQSLSPFLSGQSLFLVMQEKAKRPWTVLRYDRISHQYYKLIVDGGSPAISPEGHLMVATFPEGICMMDYTSPAIHRERTMMPLSDLSWGKLK